MRDLIFNGKKLSDFGLCIDSVDVSPPKKKLVTKSIPYMSGVYDFSALYGDPTFENRELTYTVDILEDTEEELAEVKTDVWNWLMFGERGKLYDTVNGDYYYNACCTEITDEDDVEKTTLTIKFDADPFKRLDKFTTKTISGTGTMVINNDGFTDVYTFVSISGTPITDLEITVESGDTSEVYTIDGDTGGRIIIRKGTNMITISGYGDVTIEFCEEAL